jgi:DNA-directed RNA polymerase subunit alpha
MTGYLEIEHLPKVERVADTRNYGKFVIKPLERGYGVTLGNALRRVLLSSLDGACVTSIHINDLPHEFTEIAGVQEDAIQVILQIKQIRLKLHDVDSATMHLDVHGDGVVTAADITTPGEIEIVNPDLYLFTVDDKKAKLTIDMTVERGRGYSPADDRRGKGPIGDLPVDAIYSPVKRVNWDVKSTRVDQDTNFDKLELEIWTDGTTTPEEALSNSAKILVRHLQLIAGVSEEIAIRTEAKEAVVSKVSTEVAETPIENLDLPMRVFNSLKRTGIQNVGHVLELLDKGDDAVMSIRNFGEKSLDELRLKMIEKGYLQEDKKVE